MPISDVDQSSVLARVERLQDVGSIVYYIAFLFLAVLPPLFYLRQPLLHDEMTYLVIGRELASGGTLYAGIADHKTPLIYYLAAVLWQTVPDPYVAGRLLVYAVNGATGLLLFKLGSRLARPRVGAAASLLFLVGVYGPIYDGHILMTEPFAAACLTGATVALFADTRRSDLLAGVLLAVGVLFNQTVLLFGLVVIGWSLARLYARETRLTDIAVRYGYIGTAFVLPLAAVALYAWTQGTLAETLWYTFVLPVSGYDTPYFLDGQLVSAGSFLPVWLLAAGMIAATGWRLRSRDGFDSRLVLLSLWALLLAIPGLAAFHGGHRYIFVMPAAALLAVVAVERAAASESVRSLHPSRWAWGALGLSFLAGVGVLVGATGGQRYIPVLAVGLVGGLLGAAVVTYGVVSWAGYRSMLERDQWTALVAGVFVVLVLVGGMAGVLGISVLALTDQHIDDQAAAVNEVDGLVDGRFYALGPPTEYQLAYFGDARPARTFITAPYSVPLSERVVTALERDEVPYVIVTRAQVVDGRLDPTYSYYQEARGPVVAYVEANYEQVGTTERYVVYGRVA